MSSGGAQFHTFGPFPKNAGGVYIGIKVLITEVGTTNAKRYWTDEAKTSAVDSGVLTDADGDGIASAYFDGDYRFRVTQSNDSALDNPIDWDAVKVTSDTATMWEGNFGTSFPSASAANKWQLFLKHNVTDTFAELGVNNGSAFTVIADTFTGTLNEIISAIGATDTTVVVKDSQTLTANLTIPTNVSLIIEQGGLIIKDSTYTLTINGDFQAGLYVVFSGFATGDVTFGAGANPNSHPEWWGENTTPGTTDMTDAIQSAIDSFPTGVGGTARLSNITYAFTQIIMKEEVFLFGSDWYFERNLPFANASWLDPDEHQGSILLCTSTTLNAIDFAAAVSISRIKMADFALIGPGSGSTVGINASISAGGNFIANCYPFLNNVLVGNFATGIKFDFFITNSLRDLVVKGCTTGIDLGPNVTCTDTSFYRLDIQQCTTGLIVGLTSTINFFGMLLQGNTTAVKWMKGETIGMYGVHIEGSTNTFSSDTSLSAVTLQRSTFTNCRLGDAANTWTLGATEQVVRNSFIGCFWAALSIDFSAAAFFTNNTFIAGEIGTLTDLGDVSKTEGTAFINGRATGIGMLNSTPDFLSNLGTISTDPTPNWLAGDVVEFTFDTNITVQTPTSMPEGSTITFVITQSGAVTVDFHADYNANWTNTGATTEVNTVTFKQISKQFYQIGAEKGWA